jgi:hypothetical protein
MLRRLRQLLYHRLRRARLPLRTQRRRNVRKLLVRSRSCCGNLSRRQNRRRRVQIPGKPGSLRSLYRPRLYRSNLYRSSLCRFSLCRPRRYQPRLYRRWARRRISLGCARRLTGAQILRELPSRLRVSQVQAVLRNLFGPTSRPKLFHLRSQPHRPRTARRSASLRVSFRDRFAETRRQRFQT